MLTIYGNQRPRFCDGVSRRNFLKIGALGLGGLALPQILQAEALTGARRPHKAVIMIFLPGTFVEMGLNSPRTSDGASIFKSNMS